MAVPIPYRFTVTGPTPTSKKLINPLDADPRVADLAPVAESGGASLANYGYYSVVMGPVTVAFFLYQPHGKKGSEFVIIASPMAIIRDLCGSQNPSKLNLGFAERLRRAEIKDHAIPLKELLGKDEPTFMGVVHRQLKVNQTQYVLTHFDGIDLLIKTVQKRLADLPAAAAPATATTASLPLPHDDDGSSSVSSSSSSLVASPLKRVRDEENELPLPPPKKMALEAPSPSDEEENMIRRELLKAMDPDVVETIVTHYGGTRWILLKFFRTKAQYQLDLTDFQRDYFDALLSQRNLL